MTFTELDYAWAAGIIDADGCIFISRQRAKGKNVLKTDCYRLGIKVTMGYEPAILRLREMFGCGSKHRVEQVGWNPAYTWLAQAKIARSVLDKITPYCLVKAEEIIIAYEFLDLPGWHGGQFRGPKSEEYQQIEYELWDRMRRLKPRTRYRLKKEEEALNEY